MAEELISTNPVTDEVIGRFPVASADDVLATVEQGRRAADWWAGLGFDGRRVRLLRWRSLLARRLDQLALLVHQEGGKPVGDAIIEISTAIDHVNWAARQAPRVLKPRRVRGTVLLPDYAAAVFYEPFGVVGVLGPWNYPVLTPLGSIAYALAAGNAVVYKPSEYTPAVGAWLADSFAEAVGSPGVFQVVHGSGETGAALCASGVDKIAFTGSYATARRVMAVAAETLTPVLAECGGTDAMIVDYDASVSGAVDAALWGGLSNAGQTCIGIERVYVVDSIYDRFVDELVRRASELRVGAEPDSDIGPITMPGQLDVIRSHIAAALDDGGRAVLGGVASVRPPFVEPTILVDVPETSVAVREETFGPVVVVNRVASADEAVALANASVYGLGASVWGRAHAREIAAGLRCGMVAVNGALAFVGVPSVPFGGVGRSGFGRIHGDDGLREFARSKSVVTRRGPVAALMPPVLSFSRSPRVTGWVAGVVRAVHGRRWPAE